MVGRILLIEDDAETIAMINDCLDGQFFSVTAATDGTSGLSMAKDGSYDLIVLDINLPLMNGFDVCRALREQLPEQLILILSARIDVTDKIVGLELGADDYLAKPFFPGELLARMRALLRRGRRTALHAGQLTFTQIQINGLSRNVKSCGKDVKLTAIEFDVLYYLASHAGRVITRDELKEAVWQYRASDFDSTINSHLSRIRSKIEPNPLDPMFIKTIHGIGYQFIAPSVAESSMQPRIAESCRDQLPMKLSVT